MRIRPKQLSTAAITLARYLSSFVLADHGVMPVTNVDYKLPESRMCETWNPHTKLVSWYFHRPGYFLTGFRLLFPGKTYVSNSVRTSSHPSKNGGLRPWQALKGERETKLASATASLPAVLVEISIYM